MTEAGVPPRMTIVEELVHTITPLLPLTVEAFNWNDPIVRVSSERWHLVVSCPWELTLNGDVVVTPDSVDVELVLADMVGRRLNAISIASNRIDPIFHFDESVILSVAADTDLDSWVMWVEGAGITFVGVAHES